MIAEWYYMMMLSNGNIFHVTGHLRGEFTGIIAEWYSTYIMRSIEYGFPDGKVHGANLGPVCPRWAPLTLLSGFLLNGIKHVLRSIKSSWIIAEYATYPFY